MFQNPMQQRMEQLLNQKQMIEQQMQMLQQYQPQIPSININNQPMPQNNNYDFNGKWVESEEQAKLLADATKPLILFDNNNPIFYMKQPNGEFKKYKFSEIIEPQGPKLEDKVNTLEQKLNDILLALQQPKKPQAATSTKKEVENNESVKK